jgi:heterodisulfide reductase subunit A-like polyferredoxin
MKDNVSFTLDDAKIKIVERSRGRMKIQIKLSKEEAEGFKNFCMIKPPDLPEDTFYKQIFFAGCNAMTDQITRMMEESRAAAEQEAANSPSEEPQVDEPQANEQTQD